MAAMLKTRNGISTAWSQYSLATKGTTRYAIAIRPARNQRSCTMGNIA